MKDIQDLSPTAIAKGLGLNHSRYIEKLYKPEGFTIKHIIKLANLIDADPDIILNVITKQLSSSIKVTRRK
jgi:plasmid maintenance system antidote protein VapI